MERVMRIGVCDDSRRDQAAVLGVLKKLGLEADVFDTGEALQAAIWRKPYDLVLLDIEMPGTGGYELALVLKKQYPICEIMFITEHMELVLDAFQFKPAAFVPKQMLNTELSKALDRILEKGRQNPVYVTKRKNQDRIVELNQVMKQFEAELSGEGFIRIYSNCMVNALYIVWMERDVVVLVNGEQLAVARERRESVRKAYMEYLMKC